MTKKEKFIKNLNTCIDKWACSGETYYLLQAVAYIKAQLDSEVDKHE